jgi:hypothetical protein
MKRENLRINCWNYLAASLANFPAVVQAMSHITMQQAIVKSVDNDADIK